MAGLKARVKEGGRPDPKGRHIDGSGVMNQLKNADDGHFVWVYQGDPHAMSTYRSSGYQVVERTLDGPQPVGGVTCQMGEPITFMDHVLMRVDRERHDEIVRTGHMGNSGLDAVDERMQAIRKNGGADLQGISAPYARLERDTSL